MGTKSEAFYLMRMRKLPVLSRRKRKGEEDKEVGRGMEGRKERQ